MFKTFLSRKFFSLLLSSSISILVISVLALSDSVIAGVMLGEDAVMAICLVVPAYSLAGFGACVVALDCINPVYRFYAVWGCLSSLL